MRDLPMNSVESQLPMAMLLLLMIFPWINPETLKIHTVPFENWRNICLQFFGGGGGIALPCTSASAIDSMAPHVAGCQKSFPNAGLLKPFLTPQSVATNRQGNKQNNQTPGALEAVAAGVQYMMPLCRRYWLYLFHSARSLGHMALLITQACFPLVFILGVWFWSSIKCQMSHYGVACHTHPAGPVYPFIGLPGHMITWWFVIRALCLLWLHVCHRTAVSFPSNFHDLHQKSGPDPGSDCIVIICWG